MGKFLDIAEVTFNETDDMKVLKAIWEFCSFLFVPQWGRVKKTNYSD